MPNPVKEKSFLFSIQIVKQVYAMQKEHREFVLSKQLLRSGTAIGALIIEAQDAESKADFIHKMSISLKEARETLYWISLLENAALISFPNLKGNAEELISLLTSIVKTSKSNLPKKKELFGNGRR
jgi:four helix bundle protein